MNRGAADSGGTPEGLEIRELAAADEPEVLGLLSTSLAGGPTGERTSAFFSWKHRRGVFGPSPGLVAVADGRVVGLRLFLRWEFTLSGRTVRAVRPVDTATHPDFRGRGIFRALTLDLLEQVASGTDVVFNTPNANSLPGYLRMGWRRAGTVPIAVRPVRPGAFAAGLGGQLSRLRGGPPRPGAASARATAPGARCALPGAAEVVAAASGLKELLRERAEGDERARPARLGTERTPDFLRWRYAEAPGLDYRAVTVERAGELAGIAFCRPRARGGLTELTLSDVVVRPGDREAAARLLASVARGGGCDHVATHLAEGGEAASVGLRHGYLPVPRAGMVLAVRPAGQEPPRVHGWRFTLGDLEVF
ncbi:GNAT family N-acetyltransferase [Wenjunlia tyrosinilytica]|uniref:N-acetyltransferase domain-containing protein n=1 Tax=Wenjunlia tyrosinilytica TaxID=1544741 RepID=A0A917ZVI9_9ACTN|nr:GNAT family N-acetyltransferase [Wenjunlia tyrosinilytica]GGO96202.1 hypothetical protein GCM10012280_55160 [Wenjunlia tyrosinilytica]